MELDPGKVLKESYSRILLMEFFREANLTFDLADGPKFKAMYEFMSSGLPAPTSEDFHDIHNAHDEMLEALDNVTYPNDRNYRRQIMANEYARIITSQRNSRNGHDEIQEHSVERIVEELVQVIKTEPVDFPMEKVVEPPALTDPLPLKVTDVQIRKCGFCRKQKKLNQLRKMDRGSQTILVLFLLYKTNKFTLKQAKELAKVRDFHCCIKHLNILCNAAKLVFATDYPDADFHSHLPLVINAYKEFVEIRSGKQTSAAGLGHFVRTVKKFFQRFCPLYILP